MRVAWAGLAAGLVGCTARPTDISIDLDLSHPHIIPHTFAFTANQCQQTRTFDVHPSFGPITVHAVEFDGPDAFGFRGYSGHRVLRDLDDHVTAEVWFPVGGCTPGDIHRGDLLVWYEQGDAVLSAGKSRPSDDLEVADVRVTGTCVEDWEALGCEGPDLTTSSRRMAFVPAACGEAWTQPLFVANNGNEVLDLEFTVARGADLFTAIAPMDALESGGFGVVDVSFEPACVDDVVSPARGLMVIESNDPVDPQVAVQLYGG